MVKKDLTNVFYQIPITESDWWLLGFYWNKSYWIDRFLLFNFQTSPIILDLFAKSLYWILLNLGWWKLLYYLNNFCLIYLNCSAVRAHAKEFNLICSNVGFNVRTKKDNIEMVTDFLGIELNTIAMKACFSFKKL